MAKGNGNMPQGLKTAMYWVLGIGIIALIILILLILFGNLSGNLGFAQDTSTFSGETINLNDTGSTPLTARGRIDGSLSSVVITNATGGETIESGNYTITGVVITSATATYNQTNVNVSAIVAYDSRAEMDADNVIYNYSRSGTNTTTQLPVVGTIIGVAVLLIILLGVLGFAIRKMMNVAGGRSGLGSSSTGKFRGSSNSDFA